MQYPICIEWGDENTAIGIQIPDIPGAVTAGDTFEDAYNAAVEIAHIMLQEIVAGGESIPMPTSAAEHRGNPGFGDHAGGGTHGGARAALGNRCSGTGRACGNLPDGRRVRGDRGRRHA